MYVKRLIEKTLKEAAEAFPAVFIGGSRRVGKTTLSKSFFEGYNYVLLDEIDIRSLAIEDPRGFLEKYPPPVIIDEIQNAPDLLSHIKARIEHNKKHRQWIQPSAAIQISLNPERFLRRMICFLKAVF